MTEMNTRAQTRKISEVEHVLRNINWSFTPKSALLRNSTFNVRKYHWYPATFIPEIPYTLIDILSYPGSTILDPFGGIGTTFFQAIMLRRIPTTIDVNPVSSFIISTLLRLFDTSIDIMETQKRIIVSLEQYNHNINYSGSAFVNEYFHTELRQWYTPSVFNQICFLKASAMSAPIEDQATIMMVLSSLMCYASNQDRGWACIADNMIPKPYQERNINLLSTFKNRLSTLIKDIERRRLLLDSIYQDYHGLANNSGTVLNKDVLSFNDESIVKTNSIDLVITSPPYPKMADYTTSQRLSNYLFEFDIGGIKELEIGARYRRKNLKSLEEYSNSMDKSNEIITSKIKPNGYLCYVMPSFGIDTDNNIERRSCIQRILAKIEEHGMIKEMELERVLPDIRRSHNIRWMKLKKEIIYIYRKL